ncbi:MAG: hypothetical protein IKV32_04945 [Muribaculaceae bacterium]|nr:hypothetical protein [Muribaculaceae bacterium]
MELLGIFITKKRTDEALAIFDNLNQKYGVKHSTNVRQEIALCKFFCHDAAKAITECFEAEMWGPKRCLRRLEQYQSNDNVDKVPTIAIDTIGMLLGLRKIMVDAIPIKDLPSCKHLTELSTGDAVSVINDLGKNNIVKAIVCAGLLGKNIADRIEISDVEKFYMRQIEELERELAEEHREMCDIEVFLMAKYKAELGYCHQARVKTGIGVVKEIVGIIKNVDEVIHKYEEMAAPKQTPSLTCK